VQAAIGLLAAFAPPGLSAVEAAARARILWLIMDTGQTGITVREIQRAARSVPPGEVQRHVEDALARGSIESVAVVSGPRGGRPGVRYRFIRGDTTSPLSASTMDLLTAKTKQTGGSSPPESGDSLA